MDFCLAAGACSCSLSFHRGKVQSADRDSTTRYSRLHTMEKCLAGKPAVVVLAIGHRRRPASHHVGQGLQAEKITPCLKQRLANRINFFSKLESSQFS